MVTKSDGKSSVKTHKSLRNRLPNSKRAVTKASAVEDPIDTVLKMMKSFGQFLQNFRAAEGLTQQEMADRLQLSNTRYGDYENMRRIAADQGCSLHLLLRVAKEKGITLPQFISELSGVTYVERETIPSQVFEFFNSLSIEAVASFLKKMKEKGGKEFLLRWAKIVLLVGNLPEDKQLDREVQFLRDFLQLRMLSPQQDKEARSRASEIMAISIANDGKK